MPRKRIYISSTYKDVLQYRALAAAIIEDLGHTPVDSYKAGPSPTLQQCIDDVGSSDYYLGIIGLRYGEQARSDDPRSYTHWEYDSAVGKDRLMLMLDGSIADLHKDSAIRQFRNSISLQSHPALFQANLDSFSAVCRSTLKERVPPGEKISPLLPYYCDRRDHYTAIDRTLHDRCNQADTRPTIFVVHGDERQSGREFIEVLASREMKTFSALKGVADAASVFYLDWPSKWRNAADFRRDLLEQLAAIVLRDRFKPVDEVERAILANPGPVVIHTSVMTTQWEKTGADSVQEFFQFWDSWTGLARHCPVMVILRIEYDVVEGGFAMYLRRRKVENVNKAIRQFVQAGYPAQNTLFHILEELPRIPMDQALSWAALDEVSRIRHTSVLDPQIRRLYDQSFAKEPGNEPPMQPLAAKLLELLKAG